MKADARLAIPVLLAWAVAIGLLGPTEDSSRDEVARLVSTAAAAGALTALASFFAARRWSAGSAGHAGLTALGLTSLFSVALAVAILVHLPSHVSVPPWQNDPTASYPWFLGWAQGLREGLSDAARGMPGVGGQLIPGLAIGDTSQVSESLSTSMKAVSLTHITAVSGANCVIVTAAVVLIGAKIGLSRTWRITAAIVALAAFVILVTPQASVVRAAVMSTVVLITLAAGRPGTGVPLLSLATIVMLVVNPWWAIDFGFILSVCATAGLLVLARPLARSLARFMPELLAAVISIPLAAQLACQPAIILLQPQIPSYGVVANVLAGPAAPLATIAGLLACLVLPFLPPLGFLMLWVSWVPAQWIGQTAVVVAGLPSPSIPWLAGGFGAVLAALVSVAICLALLNPRKPVRRISGLLLCLACGTYGAAGVLSQVLLVSRMPSDWVIAACDVGQGDAILFRDGDNVALIDTGRKPEPLAKCLSQLGLDHVDLLVLTHYDLDHVGGVAAVNGKVSAALVGTPQNAQEELIVADLSRGGAIVERGDKGDEGALGNSQWEVLWPAPGHSTMQDGNPGSITVRWETPELSAIFLGDLGEAAQNAVLAEEALATVDVVKVAHHGSGDQSPALYRRLQARLGIVSVGQENSYGHPTADALSLLRDVGTDVVRTDLHGLVLVSAPQGRLSVWTER